MVAEPENRKPTGAGQIANQFRKYGGEEMYTSMVMLYSWIWENEFTPQSWREGVLVNLCKQGEKADPGN